MSSSNPQSERPGAVGLTTFAAVILRTFLLAALWLAVTPATAHAHLVNTGFGPFYDGISHLFLSLDDLLAVLAMALLAGLGGSHHGRLTLFALAAAWLGAGLLGLEVARIEVSWPMASALSFLVVGLLVAINRDLPYLAVAALAITVGLLHGYLNGTAMSQIDGGTLALVGVAAAVFTIVALVAAFVTSLRAAWARVGVRVAGSWIAAIGLLMLGWAARSVG
jgi:hydrogenase/urease accessory protein HupE